MTGSADMQYGYLDGYSAYRFSTDGTVWSRLTKRGAKKGHWRLGETWKPIRPSLSRGYQVVTVVNDDGVRKSRPVHRLILESFRGPCPPGMQGCHNDGKASNCELANLRWDTPQNNILDKKKHGTMARGARIKSAKLSEPQVVEIRRLCAMQMQAADIAKQFNITRAAVKAIKCGRTWRHVVEACHGK